MALKSAPRSPGAGPTGINTPVIFAINTPRPGTCQFRRDTSPAAPAVSATTVTPDAVSREPGNGLQQLHRPSEDEDVSNTRRAAENPRSPIFPSREKAKAEGLHAALIEELASKDESLMEEFFEKGTLTEEQIAKGHEDRA